jgi:nicotinamidase-related amidase
MNTALGYTALILVDIQNEYFPGGKRELEGALPASVKARQLLEHFRQKVLPVFHIQHVATHPGKATFMPCTEGIKIHANVAPLAVERVFVKHYPNSFRDTPLLDALREGGIQRLVVAGSMTHMCIDTTVRAGYDLGFEILLAADACATRSLSYQGQIIPAQQVHAAFLAAIDGTFAQVLPVDEILVKLRE